MGLICPFCNASIAINTTTYRTKKCLFNEVQFSNEIPANYNVFRIEMIHCPNCGEVSFAAQGEDNLKDYRISLYPKSLAKKFPEYIPLSIRNDYEEAYSILELSPKASATLSRRCLQGMIRDFWQISKKTLYEEISELQNLVPEAQWQAIDALRSIGNVGAHMEKDVNVIVDIESEEAEKLIKLIELLINKWYIARHDEEELYNTITDIKNTKISKKEN